MRSFRFRDLPIEIQLKIFRIFKPLVTPAPWSALEIRDETVADHATAFNITALDKTTLQDFGPHLYQCTLIKFTEPTSFANDFLFNATDVCLCNLRYLRCTLNYDSFLDKQCPSARINRLAKVISMWTELSTLERFELVMDSRFLYNCGLSIICVKFPEQNTIVWNLLDTAVAGKLSEMQRLLTSRTFRGFEVERKLCPESTVVGLIPRRIRRIAAMVITFVRSGQTTRSRSNAL